MDNIERFNRTAAAIFKLLYENFPTPLMKLDIETLRTSAGLPPADANSAASMFSEMGDVMVWLKNEGFVRYSDSSRTRLFIGAVLTGKGLEAMSRVPDALTSKQTVGERLKHLGRETSDHTVGQLVQIAISSGIAAATRLASG